MEPIVRHLVLDSEAVSALLTDAPGHRKRAEVLASVMAASGGVRVPTPVRVEAGWDRRDPTAANANRLAPTDVVLDRRGADRAAELRRRVGRGSTVDACVVAAADHAPEGGVVEILTSDLPDLQALAGHLARRIDVRRL